MQEDNGLARKPDTGTYWFTLTNSWTGRQTHVYRQGYAVFKNLFNSYHQYGQNVRKEYVTNDKSTENRTLTYQMVTVRAAVYGLGDKKWAFISFMNLGTISDNIGWVKVSELMEYGEDNYHLLTYPVELKEGTTDLQTGKAAHMDHFKITKISDDRVSVVSEGGQGYEVAPQAVIF